jgi:hypothetical protein
MVQMYDYRLQIDELTKQNIATNCHELFNATTFRSWEKEKNKKISIGVSLILFWLMPILFASAFIGIHDLNVVATCCVKELRIFER